MLKNGRTKTRAENLPQNWLQNSGLDFIAKEGICPLNSPELNPLDYTVQNRK